jgi:hypothetical protein
LKTVLAVAPARLGAVQREALDQIAVKIAASAAAIRPVSSIGATRRLCLARRLPSSRQDGMQDGTPCLASLGLEQLNRRRYVSTDDQ